MKIKTLIQDKIFIIQINRPEKRNCIDKESADLLEQAWLSFRDNEELWVAILTGTDEKAFCSGADLTALAELGPGFHASASNQRHFISHGKGFMGYTRQTDIFKPILAAINGDALAGGLELACLADMRIVEEHARFGVACRRWNVPLADGGTQRLPRIVGMGWAMELILTGKFIDAKEAYRIGLANEVVPKGQSLPRAIELAKQLCELPQGAMRTDKQAAVMGYGKSLEEGLRIEAEQAHWAILGNDMLEGAKAFKEKRKADFKQED